jgi:hypothetical protein
MRMKRLFLPFLVVFTVIPLWLAAEPAEVSVEEDSESSPWLITPLISSDPKIATAGGALAGYVHEFDEYSPASLIGVAGTYSTTDSWYLSAFAKLHFLEDTHRLSTAVATGQIKNDYSDFLGSGLPAQTTDDLKIFAVRYSYNFWRRWYLGPQFIAANYLLTGDDPLSSAILDQLGLTGFRSNGLGLYAAYDSRDNQYSPSMGQVFEAHNLAYRKSFGGETSFDVYTIDYQYYIPFRENDVLAMHTKGRWTQDAPPGGYSSVDMRGYTRGQYLAPHMTMGEVDYRYSVYGKWGVAAFAGAAVLYGYGSDERDAELYPGGGAGVFYKLNDEGMVVRADIAFGKEGNHGFYLQFGHGFEK